MHKKFIKCLIITIFSLFTLTTSVFAETISINVNSDNTSTITINDVSQPIYSIQLELFDTNLNNSYTFSGNSNYFYKSVIKQTSDEGNTIILLVDEVGKYLATSDNLLVGVLSSTGKPNFYTTANLTLVDYSLNSVRQENVPISITYSSNINDTDTDNSSNNNNNNGNNNSNNNTTSGNSASLSNSTITSTEDAENIEVEIIDTETQKDTIKDFIFSISSITLPKLNQYSVTFNDTEGFAWAEESIKKLASTGIISGDGKGSFNPSGNSKRADVVIMLIKLLGLENYYVSDNDFLDVFEDKYYFNYVSTAKYFGIVNGSNGYFNPENNISRQDTMVMVSNILKQLDISLDTNSASLQNFSDFNEISEYAKESVSILVNLGIINGSNGQINPKNPVTRAEMSIIISKLYDLLENEISSTF